MKCFADIGSKKRIQDVAEVLFAAKGFESTSIRTIAKETGLNTAMISYYFGSKNGLYESIISLRLQDFNSVFKKLGQSRDSNCLDAFLSLYISWFDDHHNFFRIINSEFSSNKNSLLKEMISSTLKEHFFQMRDIIMDKTGDKIPYAGQPVFIYLIAYGLLQAYLNNSPICSLARNIGITEELNPGRIKEYLFKLTGRDENSTEKSII